MYSLPQTLQFWDGSVRQDIKHLVFRPVGPVLLMGMGEGYSGLQKTITGVPTRWGILAIAQSIQGLQPVDRPLVTSHIATDAMDKTMRTGEVFRSFLSRIPKGIEQNSEFEAHL